MPENMCCMMSLGTQYMLCILNYVELIIICFVDFPGRNISVNSL
jgi:hypothetical protein